MGLPVSRIGDIFVGVCLCLPCCCPPPVRVGVIVTGSPNHITCSMPTSRVSDIGIGVCGHPTVIVTGAPNVYVNSGLNCARITSVVVGCIVGTVVTGCGKAMVP